MAVNKQGRITLPSDVRRALGLRDGSQLEVKMANDVIQLRPVVLIPEEDRWAYTPEALASLKRALVKIEAGRVFEMSEEQILEELRKRRKRKRKR